MIHTAETINALLARNDKGVYKALRTVRSVCGFCFGGHDFGVSLLEGLAKYDRLTDRQLEKARALLKPYAVVLARVANDKAKGEERPAKRQPVENDDERWHPTDDEDGERARWAAEETRNEIAYNAAGYNDIDW